MEIDRIGHDAVKRRSRGGEITGHDGAKYAACVDIFRVNAVMKFPSIDRDPERLMLALRSLFGQTTISTNTQCGLDLDQLRAPMDLYHENSPNTRVAICLSTFSFQRMVPSFLKAL